MRKLPNKTISGNEHQLVSAITNEAVNDLGLKKDDSVMALIKLTETMLVKGEGRWGQNQRSQQNQQTSRRMQKRQRHVMASVTIEAGALRITSAITRQAVDDLQLSNGDAITAVFKATEVTLQKAA